MRVHHSSASVGRRAASLATAAVVGGALLAACDSSDVKPDGTGTITVGLSGNIFDVSLWTAKARGYFRARGLDVKFVKVTAATGTPALQSGSLQFLNAAPNSFLSAVAKNIPQTAVGMNSLGNPLGILVSNEFARKHHLTTRSSSQQVARALAGSTGGVSSSNTKGEAGVFLKGNGVSPARVHWVTLPNPASDKAALNNGQIDWFITSEPIPLQMQHAADGVVVANSRTAPAWSGDEAGYGQVLVARESWAAEHAATTRRFVAAVQEATAFLHRHTASASAVSAAQQALPGVPEPVLRAGLKEVGWPEKDSMSATGWKKTFDFVNALGALPKGAGITSEDWTNKYLP